MQPAARPAAAPRERAAPFPGLLKSWRASRRMSQLDLSLSCGVSQRNLSFLESGRAKPSQRMVLALSDALDVPLRDQNTLLVAAGFAPRFLESTLDETTMAPVREALTRTLEHHEPFPAVVINRHYDLMLQNRAFGALMGLFGDADAMWSACCPEGPRNLARLTLHPAGARPYIRNFADIAPTLARRLQRDLADDDGPLAAFLASLQDEPIFAGDTGDPDLPDAGMPVVPLVLGQGEVELHLFSMISTFGTPQDVTTDEIRVETFFPGNPDSETLLRQLAAAHSAAAQ